MDITIPEQKVKIDLSYIDKSLLDLDKRIRALENAPIPTPIPPIGNTIFSPTSIFYQKLADNAPIHAQSASLIADLIKQTKGPIAGQYPNVKYRPAFGEDYSPSMYIITDPNVPKVKVRMVENGVDVTWKGIYPFFAAGIRIPKNVVWGQNFDHPLSIRDMVDDTYVDIYSPQWNGNEIVAVTGGFIKNASKSDGVFQPIANSYGVVEEQGAAASCITHMVHMPRLAELKSGVIKHAVGIQIGSQSKMFKYPARRYDAYATYSPSSSCHGTRFRFPANIVINPSWAPIVKMYVTAIRDYGAIQYDQANSVCFNIECFKQFPGESLEQFCGGLKPHDDALMAQFPFDKLLVVNS